MRIKNRNLAKIYNMVSNNPKENFTDFIVNLKSSFDQSVESVSGIHGRPKDYEIDKPVNYKNPEQVITYFKSCYDMIQKDRKDIYQETWIQNQVDEIATLFAETLYLLSLK